MEIGNFKFHRRALFVFWQFDVDEQARIREKLVSLADVPPAEWVPEHASKMRGSGSFYLLPVDDDWRLVVEAVEGGPLEIDDIVHRERLEFFAKAAANAGR